MLKFIEKAYPCTVGFKVLGIFEMKEKVLSTRGGIPSLAQYNNISALRRCVCTVMQAIVGIVSIDYGRLDDEVSIVHGRKFKDSKPYPGGEAREGLYFCGTEVLAWSHLPHMGPWKVTGPQIALWAIMGLGRSDFTDAFPQMSLTRWLHSCPMESRPPSADLQKHLSDFQQIQTFAKMLQNAKCFATGSVVHHMILHAGYTA
ncbi:hypothetical protein GOP47_0029074 [Adiantum capillus-veneris]|nr:hypothetical protein GOP47_0029074 [Adiantum capillus-veneris]